jgi:hypothetical protein
MSDTITSEPLVKRRYYTSEFCTGGPSHIHDLSDKEKDIQTLVENLTASLKDGEEFQILIQKTGNRPFGNRRITKHPNGHFLPETEQEAQTRLQSHASEETI